jgi:hypothetical protein
MNRQAFKRPATNQTKTTKAPKLRFKPGSFIREKATGQLFYMVCAHRYTKEPNEWYFILEERDSPKIVNTSSSSAVS